MFPFATKRGKMAYIKEFGMPVYCSDTNPPPKKPEPPRPAPDHPKAGFYRRPPQSAHDEKPAAKLPEVAPAGRYL